MSAIRKTKPSAPAASKWPDLRHKYRKLALPAVVAAVMAGKTKPHDRPPDAASKHRKRDER